MILLDFVVAYEECGWAKGGKFLGRDVLDYQQCSAKTINMVTT